MTKEEVPSVNPKLDAMCEMLKTIHDLSERNKMLEARIEKMKCCCNCKHYTTFNNACMEYGYFLDKCDKTKWEIKEK